MPEKAIIDEDWKKQTLQSACAAEIVELKVETSEDGNRDQDHK